MKAFLQGNYNLRKIYSNDIEIFQLLDIYSPGKSFELARNKTFRDGFSININHVI